MLILALRLILKDKGSKQHCLPFVGSNLGVEIFFKQRERQKKDALKQRIEIPRYTLYWDFNKIICEACLLFYCFFANKKNYKNSVFFHSLIIEFKEKIHPKAIVNMSREEHPPIGVNPPYSIPFLFPQMSSFQLSFALMFQLLQNGAEFIQNLTPGLKNHIRNLDKNSKYSDFPLFELKFSKFLM